MTQLSPVVPGPKGLPYLGASLDIQRDSIGYFTRMAKQYGSVVRLKIPSRELFLVTEPAYVRDILVTRQHNFTKTPAYHRMKPLFGEGLLTTEGETHKRHRRLLQPAFGRDSMPAYVAMMTGYASQAGERWRPGRQIDMRQEMMRVTLAIITRALFGADVEGDAKDVGKAMSELEEAFRIGSFPFAALLQKLPLPANKRGAERVASIRQMMMRQIDEHRAQPERHSDLLSSLLALRYEDGAAFNDIELRDELITLFSAGHATSALALTWTWYLLARHPECEKQMHRELDAVLEGRLPELADLPRLPYTANVVAESLRLYPPAWMIGRMAVNDFDLGGYAIRAGSVCLMSQYLLQHNEQYFPAPESFLPERWTDHMRETLPKLCYFPFGAGARVCIGERFALMEIVLVLATIARRWRFQLLEQEPVKVMPRILLRPATPIQMSPVAR